MKTLLVVAALVAVAYCKMDTICKDKVTTKGREVHVTVEKRENEKLVLKCPSADRSLCMWYHEDRRIPLAYGRKVTVNSKGSLSVNRLEVQHSGTYSVDVSGRRTIYNLVVIPLTFVDLRDDLRARLETDPPRYELKDEVFERKYLHNTVLKDLRIRNVQFIDIHLHKVEFVNVDFVNVTFKWTDDQKKIPIRVSFIDCNFENVRWENVLLEKSQFKKCRWVERDETQATFRNVCVRDTVFCDNMWLTTRWVDGEVYNTTFIKNRFDRHSFTNTKFLNFHVDRIPCNNIEAGSILIDWEIVEDSCFAYVHRPNTERKEVCEICEENEKKRCEFYASVKFWECRLRKVIVEAVHLKAVEWRRTTFEECLLKRTLIEENYFTVCQWKKNVFERVTVSKFSRFLANKFAEDDLFFLSTDLMWFHSCKFTSVKLRWSIKTVSRRIHFEKCVGDCVEITGGRHAIFRFVDSVMTNTKILSSTITVLEHCNTMLDQIEMRETTVLETREICSDADWVIEDCKDTWVRDGVVHKDDKCKRDEILRWCKKEANRRHPVCFPFTRPSTRTCCPEKANWRCEAWQWWRSTDFKCECEKNTRVDIVRRSDVNDKKRLDKEFLVKDCIERMILEREARREHYTIIKKDGARMMIEEEEMVEGSRRIVRGDWRQKLWVRDLKRDVVREEDRFPKVEKEVCSQMKIFEAKKCCRDPDIEEDKKEECCREEKMRRERCEREFDERERLDRFKEDLERTTFCICNDRE